MVTRQPQVERRTAKVCRSNTDILPLCHATNQHMQYMYTTKWQQKEVIVAEEEATKNYLKCSVALPWSGNISRQVSLWNFIFEVDWKPCSNVCYFQRRQRGDKPPTEEEIQTALVNKPPGAPPLTILSFTRSFHGRTMGLFSFCCFVMFVILSFMPASRHSGRRSASVHPCFCQPFSLFVTFHTKLVNTTFCKRMKR